MGTGPIMIVLMGNHVAMIIAMYNTEGKIMAKCKLYKYTER